DLARIGGTVDGEPLERYDFSMPCIRPGQTGIGWGNASSITDLSRVDGLRVTYSGTLYDAVPFTFVRRDTAEIYDPTSSPPSSYRAVRGTYTVLSGAGMRTPDVTFVPRDAAGLPLAHLTGIDLGTYTSIWAYSTTWFEQEFAQYYDAIDYG